jgi:hypothetical protein
MLLPAAALVAVIGMQPLAIAGEQSAGVTATGAQYADMATQSCRVVGAISHRCYAFQSDATWPAGLADYHGSNGG